jgi:hypothetical protein
VSSFCDWIFKGIPKLKLKFTTEREHDPGIMKILPSLMVLLGKECSSNHPHHLYHHLRGRLQILEHFFPRFINPPLLWDMEEMY